MIHDPDILHGLLINIHQPPCAVHQPQALICQPLLPVEGIKQPDAQLLFQLFHRHRQRRLGNRQILRRLGKAARLCHGHKIIQLFDIHIRFSRPISVHPASGKNWAGRFPENRPPPADHSPPAPSGSGRQPPGTRCFPLSAPPRT